MTCYAGDPIQKMQHEYVEVKIPMYLVDRLHATTFRHCQPVRNIGRAICRAHVKQEIFLYMTAEAHKTCPTLQQRRHHRRCCWH